MRKSEGNTSLGGPKVRWENNIKMDGMGLRALD